MMTTTLSSTAVTTKTVVTPRTAVSAVRYCTCGQPAAGQMVFFPDNIVAPHAETRFVPPYPCRTCFERLFGPAMSVEEFERLSASRNQMRKRRTAFIPMPTE